MDWIERFQKTPDDAMMIMKAAFFLSITLLTTEGTLLMHV
jgi:hypothetical protein